MTVDKDDVEIFIATQYLPPGVKSIIAVGGSAYVGEIDDSTVLKYPLLEGDEFTLNRLDTERKLLEIIGPHERIIQLKRYSDLGIYLERAVNGSIIQHLESASPPPIHQRLTWCREAIEGVAWVHKKGVFHCDINPTNILLDSKLHVKLIDFQGQQLSPDGSVLLDGCSMGSVRYFRPREDEFKVDVQTELFALGSTIYFIIMSKEVYSDLINEEYDWHEKVQSRFKAKEFPRDLPVCSEIAWKCWLGEYKSAEDLLEDMVAAERAHAETPILAAANQSLG